MEKRFRAWLISSYAIAAMGLLAAVFAVWHRDEPAFLLLVSFAAAPICFVIFVAFLVRQHRRGLWFAPPFLIAMIFPGILAWALISCAHDPVCGV